MNNKLTLEYEQCFANWRFLVGLRFTVLGFFLTLSSVLLYGVLAQSIFHEKFYQYLFSSIGFVATWAIIMAEGRNRQLYDQCILRAKAIEKLFYTEQNDQPQISAKSSLAHSLLSAKPKPLRAWHTGAIYIIYITALLIWLGLFVAALFGKFPITP